MIQAISPPFVLSLSKDRVDQTCFDKLSTNGSIK